MKHLIAFLLALASTFAHAQATGDYLFQRKSASAFSAVWITPSGTNLIGFNGSGGLTSVAQSTFLTPAQGNAAYSLLGHTHTAANITDFNTAGDARWSLLAHTHTFASLTSKPTTIAGYGITDFNSLGDARWSLLGHTHSGSDITSGTVGSARLGSGTADNTTFLRGDGTWAAPTYGAPFQITATGSQDAFYGLADLGEAFHGVSTSGSAATLITSGSSPTLYALSNGTGGHALHAVQQGGAGEDIALFTGDAGSLEVTTDGGLLWTGTGAQTTATNLPAFGTATKGVVPASGGGTSNFLRADGSWTAPPFTDTGITQLTGDVTAGPGNGSQAATLASVITAGGPTGSASVVPVITYDAKGRLTTVTTATITPGAIGAPSGSGTSTGTNTGDQTITLTGNVTGSGTGSFATTIAAGAVTLARQADVATGTVFYRKTAGTGSPEVQTLATLKTDLGLTGTNSGDVTLAGTPDYITISGQTITRGQVDLATDVTGRLPFANIATVGASKLMGRGSAGGTGAMEEISLGTGLSMSGTTLNGPAVTGTNTGDQTIANTSDASSHTVTLSASGGSVQLIEGTNITLTTGGTSGAGTVTIDATGGSGFDANKTMAYSAAY
jgi:hypothetical protein